METVTEMTDEQLAIWTCKIGEVKRGGLPHGADQPMREAVAAAYQSLTGVAPDFIFSGWGGGLSGTERAVVENRDPTDDEWAEVGELTRLRAELAAAKEALARIATHDPHGWYGDVARSGLNPEPAP